MKLSELVMGAQARSEVEFTLISGQTVKAGLRLLDTADEARVLDRAQAFAVERHTPVERAKPGNPIYELGYEVATIALGVTDVDDPAKPFFDGGEEQAVKHLDRDRVAMLYERHRAFQDKHSPRPGTMSGEEFFLKVIELAEAEPDDDRPFDSLRPGLHRSFTRTLAKQLVASLADKSPPGTPIVSSTSAPTTPTAPH